MSYNQSMNVVLILSIAMTISFIITAYKGSKGFFIAGSKQDSYMICITIFQCGIAIALMLFSLLIDTGV